MLAITGEAVDRILSLNALKRLDISGDEYHCCCAAYVHILKKYPRIESLQIKCCPCHFRVVAEAALNAVHLRHLTIYTASDAAHRHPDAQLPHAETLQIVYKLKFHPSINSLQFTGNQLVHAEIRRMLSMANSREVKSLCLLIHAQVSQRSSRRGKLLSVDFLRLLKDYIGRTMHYTRYN
jgi:hypothetical protein